MEYGVDDMVNDMMQPQHNNGAIINEAQQNSNGNVNMEGGRRKRTAPRRKMSRKKSSRRNRKAGKKTRKH